MNDIGHQCANAIDLYIDNQSVIRLAKNPEFHKRTKHIDVQYHFIREKTISGEINPIYVQSEYQLADIFTKPLPRDRFEKLCHAISLRSQSLNDSFKKLFL